MGDVRNATIVGVLLGLSDGAFAKGVLQANAQDQSTAYSAAIWITLLSILVPFLYFVTAERPPKGWLGGLLNGLGMGLGFFILVFSIVRGNFGI